MLDALLGPMFGNEPPSSPSSSGAPQPHAQAGRSLRPALKHSRDTSTCCTPDACSRSEQCLRPPSPTASSCDSDATVVGSDGEEPCRQPRRGVTIGTVVQVHQYIIGSKPRKVLHPHHHWRPRQSLRARAEGRQRCERAGVRGDVAAWHAPGRRHGHALQLGTQGADRRGKRAAETAASGARGQGCTGGCSRRGHHIGRVGCAPHTAFPEARTRAARRVSTRRSPRAEAAVL